MSYLNYQALTQSSFKKNVKIFWKFVRSNKENSDTTNVMKYNNIQCSTSEDIVSLSPKLFKEVFTNKICNAAISPVFINKSNLFSYNIYYINYRKTLEFEQGYSKLHCSFVFVMAVYYISNVSLGSGIFPTFGKNKYHPNKHFYL